MSVRGVGCVAVLLALGGICDDLLGDMLLQMLHTLLLSMLH